jgi:hypothetical protein
MPSTDPLTFWKENVIMICDKNVGIVKKKEQTVGNELLTVYVK